MNNNIFDPIKNALHALIFGFAAGSKKEGHPISEATVEEFFSQLVPAFSQVGDFRKKLSEMDAIADRYSNFEPLTEYIFDLLMVNFLASDAQKLNEDYLDSPEWMEIEEETLSRGTELLNLLLYISEAKEADVEISLDDFLNEFLLAEDELYQDEYFIYEPIIRNEQLADADNAKDIFEAGTKVESDELRDIFVPLMLYFNLVMDENEKLTALQENPAGAGIHTAVLQSLFAFEKGLEEL